MTALTAAEIYRAYETPGVPESGAHKPVKSEIINYLQDRVETGALGQVVSGRTAMKAIPGGSAVAVMLAEGNRSGPFLWMDGDFATEVAADPLEGLFVEVDDTPASDGAFVRVYTTIDVRWFDAANDNTGNAAAGIQAAIDLAEVVGAATTEGPVGSVWGPPGFYRCTAGIAFSKSIVFRLEGQIYYTPTTGSAVIIGDVSSSQHTFYDIEIEGLRAVNGNGSVPTSINGSGCSGIEIRRMQFSRLRVKQIIGFTKYARWLNSTNNQFTGQHIQDNDLELGQASYSGKGLHAESVSAGDGACQVNRIYIQNDFSNFRDVDLGAAGDTNTNHNILTINALDAPGAGGSELRIFGSYNMVTLGFVDTGGIVSFESGSVSNFLRVGRNAANVTFSDAGTSNAAIFADGVRRGLERFRTSVVNVEPLALESTEAGATFAQLLELYRNSASPADNDGGAGIMAYFNDGAGNKTAGGRIRYDMPTVADGNENLRWLFDTIVGGVLANRLTLWQGLQVGQPTTGDMGAGTINLDNDLYKDGLKVVSDRRAGWAAATGTATRTTFATGSVTLPQLAEHVKALIDDLIAHGLIGA